MNKNMLALVVLATSFMHLLAQPVITAQPTNQTVDGGSNVAFSVAVSGTGPFTYQWQFNGTNLPNAIVTTAAGNGNGGYNGDGGPGDLSSISGSFGIVVDGAGNLFISDFNNSRVRKVDTNGIISTVAGNGTNGDSGDGSFATNGFLGNPSGLALDAGGNLYVADFGNNDIRKVDTNGIITTVAGTGSGTYDGDGGAATNASLFNPYGLAFDRAGNLYVADSGNNVIRRINSDGIISTVPVGGLVFPTGVALDRGGDLFIADCNGNTIIKMDANGVVTTFAGGSSVNSVDGIPATNSGVNYPRDVAVDAGGNVLIAAFYDNRVRVVNTNGIINTLAGTGNYGFSGDNGDAQNATFEYLNAMAQDSHGNIYVSDFFNNRVRAVTYSGPTLKFSNVTTNLSGIYSVVVSNLSGSVTSSVARLNVVLPPNLITQPKSQQIPVASNVTFSVSASGTEPLNYQWQFNGTNIAGATNNTFLIGVVTTNDAGNYSVTITNSYGRVASSNAALMVLAIPPSIATQPASQIVPSGSNALFTAVASGSPPFNYQWFFNGAPLNGQTSASLSLLNVTTNQAGAYSVQVASPFGSITSHIAILAVSGLPIITQQPANQSMLAGNRVLLNAGVSGLGPLTFQWQLNGTNLTNGFMTTVAGNGIPGYSGDGGIATTGMLNSPFGLAADGAGNFYFADSANNRIRKVDTGGVMTTVAGTGAPGFSGDGGAATNARLNSCYGVAIDGSGNLFIADTANNRIRKLDTNGIITTVAGRATSGFSGDGGPATNAALFGPYGVMVDATGDLFIADTSNYRVRKVEPNGIITTVAGKSSSGFSGDGGSATNASLFSPKGVAMDSEGNLIIADMDNQRVREVDVYGNISTLAGNGLANYSGDGGAATNASLLSPYAVAVDGYGDVLIADTGNNRIRRVDAYGKISTVAGTNAHGVLYAPSGITMDGYGRVLIADTGNSRIRRFGQGPTLVLDAANMTNAGNYTLVVNSSFGSITSAVATLTVLLPPSITIQPASQSIGLGSNGTFSVAATGTPPLSYLWQIDGVSQSAQTNQSLNFTNVQWSDAGSFRMVITNNYGSVTSRVATMTVGVPPSIVSQPSNQTVVAGSNGVLDVQAVGDGVFSYQWQFNGTNLPPVIATVAGNGTNGFSGDGGLATNAQISGPYGVAADKAGNVYISDYSNHRVRKVDANGIITTIAGTGTAGATGNGGPATNATLRAPQGMSLDGYGNLFFAEGNSDVRKVDTKGIITRVAGTTAVGYSLDGGQATNTALGQTTAVAVDGRGNLYLTDYYNFRIRKVDTNGIISTVAGANNGAGRSGYSGDGGPATNANLGQPTGVALDSLGGIVISDTDNYRVRAVNSSGIINTIAGGGSDGTSSGIPGTNANLKPINVAVDSWNNVFIACDNRVRMLDTNGIITTVAGGGSVRPGDFGPATSASLSAQAMAFDAQGNLLIADRSNLRIRKVWFSGLPTLLLPDASTNNAGNYSVVISSPFGSIASSMATVTVLLPPQHFAGQFGGGELQVHFSGTPNYPYILQSATNLMRPINWQPVVTNPADGNGNWQFADTNLNNGQKFYRVQMVP